MTRPTDGIVPSSSADPCRDLVYRGQLRPYQLRLLAAAESRPDERRLHLVVAPGGGRLVLGLELLCRLGGPALVLTPSAALRDRWLRQLADFLPAASDTPPPWVDRGIGKPRPLSVATFDELAKVAETAAEEPAAGDWLPPPPDAARLAMHVRSLGLRTLIMDEARLLPRAWLAVLAELVEALPELRLVTLAASPPHAVPAADWLPYQALAGPALGETSFAELLRHQALCPHQDYLYAVTPEADDAERLREHEAAVARLCRDLLADPELRAAVRAHPWCASRHVDPATVLAEPELAVAMLAFLKQTGQPLPRPLLAALALDGDQLPALDPRRWEILLGSYLFAPTWPAAPAHRLELHQRLQAAGMPIRQHVRLDAGPDLSVALTMSPSKIDGCVEIYRLESRQRGPELRQLMLTDFACDQPGSTHLLGAWPLFRRLVATLPPAEAEALGLHTESLSVVHRSRVAALRASGLGAHLRLHAHPDLLEFARIEAPPERITAALGILLTQGVLRVLVGTRAVLGEGWEANCVNSLVLACYAGPAALANLLRAPAVRADPRQPDKIASIWHLVAIDRAAPDGGADLAALERRFDEFVGVAAAQPRLEIGLARLAVAEPLEAGIRRINAVMAQRLQQRHELPERWRKACAAEAPSALPTLIVAGGQRPQWPRRLHAARTLVFLLLQLTLLTLAVAGEALLHEPADTDLRWFGFAALGVAVAASLWALPKLLGTVWLYLRHIPPGGSIRQMGSALLDALCRAGLIRTRRRRLRVAVEPEADDALTVHLQGGDFHEQSLFVDALTEMLEPASAPRHLLYRRGSRLARHAAAYHPVPRALTDDEQAPLLLRYWQRRVGPVQLIDTTGERGRLLLLRARSRGLCAATASRVIRDDR